VVSCPSYQKNKKEGTCCVVGVGGSKEKLQLACLQKRIVCLLHLIVHCDLHLILLLYNRNPVWCIKFQHCVLSN
jgi:hypothetical protein